MHDIHDIQAQTTAQTRLIEARVRGHEGRRILVALPDGEVWAKLAVMFPYAPANDDLVLVMRSPEYAYVVGVLEGTGKTFFDAPGDVEIRAGGRLTLSARKLVNVEGEIVAVTARRKMYLQADSMVERFTNVFRKVKELFSIRAGRTRTRVEGTADLRAERITERAVEDVNIDGKSIKLG